MSRPGHEHEWADLRQFEALFGMRRHPSGHDLICKDPGCYETRRLTWRERRKAKREEPHG